VQREFKALSNSYRAEGSRVYLRPITEGDTEFILSVRNSDYVMKNFFYRKPISVSDHELWLKDKIGKGLVFQFAVCLKETDEPVGSVYMQRYDEAEDSMETGLFFDQEKGSGKGLATEAYALMIEEFAFGFLKLSKVTSRVMKSNTASLRVHEKCGFKEVSESIETTTPDGEKVRTVFLERYADGEN